MHQPVHVPAVPSPETPAHPITTCRCQRGRAEHGELHRRRRGAAPFTYQWERKRATDAAFTLIDAGGEPTAATATYVTPATSRAVDDQTQFRVKVTNRRASVTSNAATLTVTASSSPPAITGQPQNRTVVEGNDASFTVVATGSNLTYQWEREAQGAQTFSPIAGQTAATLMFAAAAGDDNASYRVTVTNGEGSVTSAAAGLVVVPRGNAATVFVQSLDGTITDHSVATQSAAAYTATADLGAGTFAATSTANVASSDSYAGIVGLHLYNNSGTTVTLAAGALKVHFDGTYTHNVVPNSFSDATVTGVFTVIGRSQTYVARAYHQVSINYDAQGGVATTSNVFNNDTQVNGGMAVPGTTTLSAFSMDLIMPEIPVRRGGRLG